MRLLTWDAETFRSFLRKAPTAMKTTVRLIAPIARASESIALQQEKLAALGTLSAGLAHELNNPAAAARRTAGELEAALATLQDTIHHFVSSGVEREDAARLVVLQRRAVSAAAAAGGQDGGVAAADREDLLAGLLDDMGQEGWRLAEPLARAGLDKAWLDEVAAAAGPATGAALEWVAASITAHSLVGELHESTARISELVGAIKDYTHMDRAAVEDVDVHDGIESTLTILGHRLKQGHITVERHYDRSLPFVTVHGSDLNQVWTNLIANALDALDGEGTITITTRPTGGGRGRRGRRRRPRRSRRGAVADLRAVLHHEAGRRRDRPWPGHLAPDRARLPGHAHRAVAAGAHRVRGDAADQVVEALSAGGGTGGAARALAAGRTSPSGEARRVPAAAHRRAP